MYGGLRSDVPRPESSGLVFVDVGFVVPEKGLRVPAQDIDVAAASAEDDVAGKKNIFKGYICERE